MRMVGSSSNGNDKSKGRTGKGGGIVVEASNPTTQEDLSVFADRLCMGAKSGGGGGAGGGKRGKGDASPSKSPGESKGWKRAFFFQSHLEVQSLFCPGPLGGRKNKDKHVVLNQI